MKHINFFLILYLVSLQSNFAYSHLSPYSYCGGDPVNCIDPSGKDIVVLNYTEGEHLAMLIQNEEGKWQYYSVNGDNFYILGSHSGGRPFNDVAVGSWNTPQEFLDSSYNQRNDESKEDKNVNHYGFKEGYQITSTPEQDEKMRDSFTKTAKSDYDLFNNNCATAVQKAMVDAGIPVSEPNLQPSYIPVSTPYSLIEMFNGYQMKCDLKMIPSSAFKSIIQFNPGGNMLHKK